MKHLLISLSARWILVSLGLSASAQAQQTATPQLKSIHLQDMLRASQNRVQSMGILHQHA
ncbi:hypothetical protein [Fibrella forsythiae]|uniref:Uncharacterized protein n=1 Tax=Fibrella forsythiae TaxID=2817061 RepID=A0ABS3JKZ2_9BACT|nr:hypothetical protein [Fibrella forsythiae]MBO0950670.1 hypothetical protein [Fibrella forsythiae]